MKTVEIYIETSIKAPAVRDGKYAATLVFTKVNGESAVRFVSGEEEETTFNRCTLLAAIRALQRLNQPCYVIIYTDCAYVKNMVAQGNPEQWRRAEWYRTGNSGSCFWRRRRSTRWSSDSVKTTITGKHCGR